MKRRIVTYLIQSRSVTIWNRAGKRIKYARWGRWVTWNDHTDNADNFRDAVGYVTERMENNKQGGIVYARVVVNSLATRTVTKLYEAKWGVDKQPFTAYAGPVGNWWKEKAGL
jgi:hypothetical protein